MQSIFDAITEWLKALLVEGIMENLGGLFTGVNEQVGEIAAQVGMTPAAWNAGVFSMIRQLSETVILPIAGLVLTFVMTYELIQMLVDHNNLHNFDTWIFFKWIFKTFAAVLVLSNTFNIVMAVFDVSQHVVQQSAGLIQGSTAVTPEALENMQAQLEAMELGTLLGIFLQSFFVQFTMTALNIVVFVIVYGRMIEIYLMTSLAPIPFATIANREAGHMGHNYFKSLFAVGFQGMLYHGLHGGLRRAGAGYRGGQRPDGGHLDLRGVHGAAVLRPLQDREPLEVHMGSALRDSGPTWPEAGKEGYHAGTGSTPLQDRRERGHAPRLPREAPGGI